MNPIGCLVQYLKGGGSWDEWGFGERVVGNDHDNVDCVRVVLGCVVIVVVDDVAVGAAIHKWLGEIAGK